MNWVMPGWEWHYWTMANARPIVDRLRALMEVRDFLHDWTRGRIHYAGR